MHLLRDRHCQGLVMAETNDDGGTTTTSTSGMRSTATRRLSIGDAVYLVADVILPLLRAMHRVGIVHRDVKPSVRSYSSMRVSRGSTACFVPVVSPHVEQSPFDVRVWPMKRKKIALELLRDELQDNNLSITRPHSLFIMFGSCR